MAKKITVPKAQPKKTTTKVTTKTTIKKDNTRKIDKDNLTLYDFFNIDYLEFVNYTVQKRALPSIIDGLKPSARKILYSAFNLISKNKKAKFIDLVGHTISYSKYHHGDSSLITTIFNLGRSYSDNLHPFKIIGNNGDLRNNDYASPRYLDLKLSEFSTIYEKDSEIFDYNYDGDVRVEPIYYLPIIPTILSNRTRGIAVGIRYVLSCSYSPNSIIDCCLDVLKYGTLKTKELIPHINEFKGTFTKDDTNIYAHGIYTLKNDKIVINEFSPEETFVSFEKNLNKLIDKEIILNWVDNSTEDNTEYVVTVTKEFLNKYKGEKLEYLLKISKKLIKNNLSILDENERVRVFDSVDDLLIHFVDYRLKRYDDSKDNLIKSINEIIKNKSEVRQFIDLYLKGKIKISKDISLSETKKQIESYNLPSTLINISLSKLTKDEYIKLGKEIKEHEVKLTYVINTPPKKMYEKDLKDLYKQLNS